MKLIFLAQIPPLPVGSVVDFSKGVDERFSGGMVPLKITTIRVAGVAKIEHIQGLGTWF
ncbi:MAG: hypothetical protein VYA30_02515 [Myxococcota bacterium]|nr:hypothetical protein [Myxococcota bacterium]